jgi:radical SAM superfamily enzyme YgiQ (UPF0313 family)
MKCLLVVKSKFMESLGAMYLKSSICHNSKNECRIVSIDEAFNTSLNWKPDIIGYSVMTGDQRRFEELNNRIKNSTNLGGILSIAGGPHASFFPDDCRWADMIISGEAEQSMADLLKTGEAYCDINALPWPARDDFPNMKVRDFITSRGCPYRCSYCFNHRWAEMFPELGLRVRSVDDVVAEIKHVNPEYAYFQDSCFGVSMDWMREFAEKYKHINLESRQNYDSKTGTYLPIPYQCNFRPEMINPERGELLRKSGCVAVRMALESATNRLRSLIGRNTVTLKKVREAVDILKENRVQVMLQNIIGLPTATIEDDLFTLETNIQYRPTYSWVSIFQPYPGTDLGDWCRKEGHYKGDYSDITDSFFDTSFLEISPEYKEQLEVLQKVWAMCVDYEYLPKPEELTYKALPKLIHTITRRNGDRKLYLGLL